MAQINDPHPWSPFRWLLEISFQGMLEDYPPENFPEEPNYKAELFQRVVECCQEEWIKLTPDLKQQFQQYAEMDKQENGSKEKYKNKKNKKNKKRKIAAKSPNTSAQQWVAGHSPKKMTLINVKSKLSFNISDTIKDEPLSPMPQKTVSPAKQTSGKKQKKKRDPNLPKQAMSAFFLYMNSTRAEIKQSNPDMKNTEISTEAAKRWKEMTEEDKMPYTKMAELCKQKHEKEMVEYKQSLLKAFLRQVQTDRGKDIADKWGGYVCVFRVY